MTNYQKNTEDGYIVSLARGVSAGNISGEEYEEIRRVIAECPRAEEGFGCRLREDLRWEFYLLPEPEEEEAGEEDYLAELKRLGVNTDEEE
ncbi:MAG: hypothetical protein KBS46_06895 [Clostridiales bacterium]|nr:hypothetical protein [Candidatus Apopatocola equi]